MKTTCILFALVCCLTLTVPAQTLDAGKARTYSDAMAEKYLKHDSKPLYGMMEKLFRDQVPFEKFDGVLHQMDTIYGKPIAYEFKTAEVGTQKVTDLHGTPFTRPVRTFWYALQTSKYPKGTHFLTIMVVPDGDHLGSSSIVVNQFRDNKIPPALK